MLAAKPGIDHFMEQAMTAMLLADVPFHYAPPADYYIPLNYQPGRIPSGAFHHYAGPARKWFYRDAWRSVPPTLP